MSSRVLRSRHPRWLLSLLLAGLACDRAESSAPPTIEVGSEALRGGGLYVAYVWGCRGCELLTRGDFIVAVDGQPVQATSDLDPGRLMSGEPVRLTIRTREDRLAEITVAVGPGEGPPFYWIGAAELDRAPQWARRNLFGHVSPMLVLVGVDGDIVDGANLVGKKRLLVFWDHATRVEQAEAVNMMRVLQAASADLQAAGVDVLFVQFRFPSNDRRQAPMNDGTLRQFQATYGTPGGAYVPMFRLPNATEHKRALMRGFEGGTTWFEYMRQPPTLVLLDERGVIRWHSEGNQRAPEGDPTFAGKDDQYTLIQAIEFAIHAL